jgi:transposase
MARRVLSVRPLTKQEDRELRRVVRRGVDGRAVRRAQVVRLSARGVAPRRIADVLERSWSGVRKTINRFNREGLASLSDKPRRGRPRKTDDRYVDLLEQAVRSSPHELGYPFGCWTLERLRQHLALKTRVILSAAHLSRLLAEHDVVYRRPKHGMTHLRDPKEYDEKKAFLAFVKKGRCAASPARSTCCTSTSVRFTSTRP